jgi:sigma-B regulation protein RsbU (phosphoserine phosphatase)
LAILIGTVLVAIGAGTVVLASLRKFSKNPEILWFGLFSFLYGVRLLAKATAFRLLFDFPQPFWLYLIAGFTYFLPLAGVLFVREIVPERRKLSNLIALFQFAFAICGIVSDAVQRQPESLHLANNLIVIAYSILITTGGIRKPGTLMASRPLFWGFGVFLLTVLFANIATLRSSLNFDPEPIGFVVLLAALGYATAVRTAANQERLLALDRELDIARRIQSSILPQSAPSGDGIRIEAHYLPMTAVAGDFYEFLRTDESHFGVLIADVSGHGVPAALIASMVKIAVAAQIDHADAPARVLSGINHVLSGKMQGQYVTAAYMFFDLTNRRARYAAAGHPPMLRWCANRRICERVEKNGMVLGLFARAEYEAVELDFHPGDRFLLYTDGVTEAANERDEFFGTEPMAEELQAPACAGRILRRMSSWAGYDRGRSQDDDLTLILIEIGCVSGCDLDSGSQVRDE